MSERITRNDNRATIRWKLLTGASVLTLAFAAANPARADDSSHPTIWLELGGDADMLQGSSSTFTPPFFTFPTSAPSFHPTFYDSHGNVADPWPAKAPDVYGGNAFAKDQAPARFTFGGDAQLTFQPEGSDWLFSAAIRYGRSHSKRQAHHQAPPNYISLGYPYTGVFGTISKEAFSDVQYKQSEHHAVVDFTAGKDVGIGLFGPNGTSTVSAGVQFAQFTSSSGIDIIARPSIYGNGKVGVKYQPYFRTYYLHAHQSRSFKGVGPLISWKASAALAGNPEHGELVLDWGIDASVMFGRQKAKTDHRTSAYHKTKYGIVPLYAPRSHNAPLRSRRVTVPEVSGFIGLSAKLPHSKISIGYKGDIWFKAMDTGIDARKTSNLTFNGPYASISIGLGD